MRSIGAPSAGRSLGAIRPGDEVGSAQRVDDSIGRNAAGCGPFATDHLPVELPGGVSIGVDGEAATCLHCQSEQPLRRVEPLGTRVDLNSDVEPPARLEYAPRIELRLGPAYADDDAT